MEPKLEWSRDLLTQSFNAGLADWRTYALSMVIAPPLVLLLVILEGSGPAIIPVLIALTQYALFTVVMIGVLIVLRARK